MDKRVGLSVIFRLSDAEKSRFKPDVRAPILARCARRGARGCRPARARGLLLDLFGAQPPSSLSFAQARVLLLVLLPFVAVSPCVCFLI